MPNLRSHIHLQATQANAEQIDQLVYKLYNLNRRRNKNHRKRIMKANEL
jgi:hypothetical protein